MADATRLEQEIDWKRRTGHGEEMDDPEVFVIGGGVSAAGEYFINLIDKYYKECVFHASRQTKIVKAALGNDAGMYGAAKLILGN